MSEFSFVQALNNYQFHPGQYKTWNPLSGPSFGPLLDPFFSFFLHENMGSRFKLYHGEVYLIREVQEKCE